MTEEFFRVWSWALEIRSRVSNLNIPKKNLRPSPKIHIMYMYLVSIVNEWSAHRVSPSQAVIRWITCRQWNKFHIQAVLGSWTEDMGTWLLVSSSSSPIYGTLDKSWSLWAHQFPPLWHVSDNMLLSCCKNLKYTSYN